MSQNSQAIYEISVFNLGASDRLTRTKMAIMNFSPDSDRYTQIEETVRRRFKKAGKYTVSLMKPADIVRLNKLADDGLFARVELPSGIITQFIEIGNSYWEY
jgi:hypothetical protein